MVRSPSRCQAGSAEQRRALLADPEPVRAAGRRGERREARPSAMTAARIRAMACTTAARRRQAPRPREVNRANGVRLTLLGDRV